MKVLIKQVKINDPASPFHNITKDILVENGIISVIDDSISINADSTIDIPNMSVSPGWMDVFAHFCDPGYEHKETLFTGAAAAAAGGFTTVMVLPNTKPVVDSKSQVEYIVRASQNLPAQILPIGAISKKTEGKELAEMYDMFASGAVAFSDGLHPVQSSGILVKGLQYVKAFDGVIIQLPDDESLAAHGLVNEGVVSTKLGLPGKPAIAEELIVARDIQLAQYTGSNIHFTGISSAGAVALIKKAKNHGVNVTCSVTPYHLAICDEELVQYDTNLKVNPPLRTREDMEALRVAVADGTIDCIATHHIPQDFDSKITEFEYAQYGMTGLETCYSILRTYLPQLQEERIVELLSINPRKIFKQPADLSINHKANLTLYLPDDSYTFTEKHVFSKCRNTPFLNKQLRGVVAATILGENISHNCNLHEK